jgi:intergrase/recombinase
LDDYDKWLKAKFSDSYRSVMFCYARKYRSYLKPDSNLRDLERLSPEVKSSAVKALILVSKYKGTYKQFKERLSENGIRLARPDSLHAFLRILNASRSDVMMWYNSTIPMLKENEQLLSKFLLHSGLRMNEAIKSFNQIIELFEENNLNEYYDENLKCLCHFKYPQQFIRRTKNCFITFITPEFLREIASSEPASYNSIRKRLERQKAKLRFNELRDYFGTYLLQHGILEAEVNLLQGRIPVSVFIRHYWSPKLKELSNNITALTENIGKPLARNSIC